ncbi:MAG: type II toxin-antitoxin system RelE/ParE family toxin [Rhodospirillaceae bacterium]|nr:type II toxin-antitoxin system RelE/ParE family toxin [Rhodospirillaceae bacterium]
MRRLIILPAARADLREVLRFIARDNPTAARRFVNRIEQKCRDLVLTPFAGRERNELKRALRSISTANYQIFYMVDDDEVRVVRVLHGRRDMKRQFE